MKHFLLVYRRSAGKLLECRDLGSDREAATAARLETERAYRVDTDVEVVVLTSPSREVLERTHSRYFRTAGQLADALSTST